MPDLRKLVAEGVGTFALVFAGTGAIVVNDVTGGVIGHVGVALVFGLVVMAMIYTVGDVSGAHLNPAVSLGFGLAGRHPLRSVAAYVAAQLAGAIAASALLSGLFPAHETLGATLAGAPVWRTFVLEVVITALLMLTILRVSTGSKEKGVMAGIAVGGVVALVALFAGPISGGSMNPARSLGPALVAGVSAHQWVYVVAPALGALGAVGVCRLLDQNGECCAAPQGEA